MSSVAVALSAISDASAALFGLLGAFIALYAAVYGAVKLDRFFRAEFQRAKRGE